MNKPIKSTIQKNILIPAITTMVRSIVRLALRNCILLPEFINIIKTVYVEVAAEDMKSVTEKINVSRISVMSGVHRKDVTTIYKNKKEPITKSATIWAKVIGRWEQDKRYTTKAGKPRMLTFEGEKSEFHQLVTHESKGFHPSAILFELERLGLVEKTKQGLKLLSHESYLAKDIDRGFTLIARNIESVLDSGIENLLSREGPVNHFIRTEYDNIQATSLPEIRSWLIEEGKSFHKRLRDYLAPFDLDISDSRAGAGEGAHVAVASFSITSMSQKNY